MANASLHVHHMQQSLAAMQIRGPDNILKPNLVIVTGQPLWYTSNTIPHPTALHTSQKLLVVFLPNNTPTTTT